MDHLSLKNTYKLSLQHICLGLWYVRFIWCPTQVQV